jgi:hypothetical protein
MVRRTKPRRLKCSAAIFGDKMAPKGWCRKRHMHTGRHEIRTWWQRLREACEI